MPVSKADVRNGFRFILGREPENNLTVLKYMLYPTLESFRVHLLRSKEFQSKHRAMGLEVQAHPAASRYRPATVFIHLQKTGGMTFHALLARRFEQDRVFQAPQNMLHLLSIAELGWFDLFSGHFDYASTKFIQRPNVCALSFFREPRQRLVSFYRFMRSHPLADEFQDSRSVELAHSLSAEEFFEHDEVRAAPEVFNHYLLTFGLSSYDIEQARPLNEKLITSQIMERAEQNVRALAGIGITERFDESVTVLFNLLGFRAPRRIVSRHVTDRMGKTDKRFSQVEPVAMTPRLLEAMDELVRFDREIYEIAVSEYERRRNLDGLAASARA